MFTLKCAPRRIEFNYMLVAANNYHDVFVGTLVIDDNLCYLNRTKYITGVYARGNLRKLAYGGPKGVSSVKVHEWGYCVIPLNQVNLLLSAAPEAWK